MHKDILILTQYYYPEYNSASVLTSDAAEYLAASGFDVGVLCGVPKEFCDQHKLPKNQKVNGVDIKRINYLHLNRKSKLGRIINNFSFTFNLLFHIGKLKNCKSIVVYTNPPILPVIATIANVLFKVKLVSVSFDVYPEIAYSSHSLSPNGVIAKCMRFINNSFTKRVSNVVALTDEMKDFLITNRPHLDSDKVCVIPNWAHEDIGKVTTDTKQSFGYKSDDFVVLYGGLMGVCQDMQSLIQAADILKNDKRIKFFICGHGSKTDEVIEKTSSLPNVKISNHITGDDFLQALKLSSCGIVSLIDGVKGTCAPSKLYSYLQAGLPVVAVVQDDSYLADEVLGNNIGFVCNCGDGRQLAQIIRRLCDDTDMQTKMSHNAAKLYRSCYTKDICMQKYMQMFDKLLDDKTGH